MSLLEVVYTATDMPGKINWRMLRYKDHAHQK
jgi:hypothetical protein